MRQIPLVLMILKQHIRPEMMLDDKTDGIDLAPGESQAFADLFCHGSAVACYGGLIVLGVFTGPLICRRHAEIMEQFELAPQRHNELILPMCESLLSEFSLALNQLDAIAFGCGPGAFTGVRIAAGVTQGIALAHALPVIPISTLANLAQQALVQSGQIETVMPAIDARMHEVYWAIYKKNANS